MSIFKRALAMLSAVAVLIFSMNISACAASELSLIVECAYNEEAFSGVGVSVYRVAQETDSGIELTGEFEKYSVLINSNNNSDQLRAAALALASYAKRDSITPCDYGNSDINGNACFTIDKKGVYLVVTDDYTAEESTFTAEPFLVFLSDDGADMITKPKFFDNGAFLSTSVKVLKVWEDSETQRPDEIEIELIRNGEIVDTVILNEETNWRYTWNNLEKSNYLVCEKNVPEGYAVSVSREGITFVIRNTAKGAPSDEGESQPASTTPESDSESKLPQTGVLKWPVPYLACAGLLLLMAGWVINRKNELKNEK